MRLAFSIIFVLSLAGCARVWVKEDMMPDRSWKILVAGNGPASIKQVKDEAYRRAGLLCPQGYDRKGEVPDDSLKPSYTLVVLCRDAGAGK